MMLSDETIRLRALEPEDLCWLYEIENDTDVWQHGVTNVPYSYCILKKYISETSHDIYADGQLRLVIEAISDHKILGCVDLCNYDVRHSRAEVGIIVLPSYRNKRIASRALHLLIDYCASFLYLHQVYAMISIANEPAKKLFLKAGFKQELLVKDWLRVEKDKYCDALMLCCILP